MAQPNPYAAPQTRVADEVGTEQAPPLWNPDAAASWSLLFSPAFGALLHMLNWNALGRPDQAAMSRRWLITSFTLLAAYVLLPLLLPESPAVDRLSTPVGFAFLVAWYFSAGRVQARHVRDRFGKSYPRRPWGLPLLAALGVMVVYFILAMAIYFVSFGAPAD